MAVKGYRIISLEANELYSQEKINGVEKGYVLPKKKNCAYFRLFKNVFDYSLDLIELEKCYYQKCRNSFSFEDEYNNKYTLAIINLKFNYTFKDETEEKDLKQLRAHFYKNGFNLDGVHYVRYKRSSGSARRGKCLFINEKLINHMTKWGDCGLNSSGDLASWEAYKSLALSSLKGIIEIPLEGILFINDCKSEFLEDVVSVEEIDGSLNASTKKEFIENSIWDGESLLDESLFAGNYENKHMLLLRNKFFKSCGFKTKLQKWFEDKNITLEDLKARGFVTLASDIKQIVMVTTKSSMKFLKFMGEKLTHDNVREWVNHVDSTFGVAKYDKRTKFFGGKMVQCSYQFINTLNLNEQEVEILLQPSKKYLTTIRDEYAFMCYHFSDAYKREKENDEIDEVSDGLAERSEIIFKLMQINSAFKDTELYYNFRNEVIKDQKKRIRQGHILLPGTNATLFGNGPEMLLALAGEFDINSTQNKSIILGSNEIACAKFENNEKLVCARSPHITMGNLYCATNNLSNSIWEYFDLGENVVCVNAIGENIQQRLNGCDYDSDSMLITNHRLIVEKAFEQKDYFKVPVCKIKSSSKRHLTLVQLDHNTSENKIGNIVNLSQKLNSIYWDKINDGYSHEALHSIYEEICKLAVLSGIEIDKAKRAYDKISVSKEITAITENYKVIPPQFFKEIQFTDKAKSNKQKEYYFYKTPMEYVFKSAKKIDYRKAKNKKQTFIPISDMLKTPTLKTNSTVYDRKNRIVDICIECKRQLQRLYILLREVDEDEKEVTYLRIKQLKEVRNKNVKEELTEEYVVYLLLKEYEKVPGENWHIYASLLETDLFQSMLKASKKKMPRVIPQDDGEYDLYGLRFTKK